MSFDIGIKNMAYCILTHSSIGPPVSIMDWKVLNLMEQEAVQVFCTCILAKSTKLTKKQLIHNKQNNIVIEPIKCGKLAKFQKNGVCYCEKHAKLNTAFFIPKKCWLPVSLKKLKNEELLKLCAEHNILFDTSTKIIKKTILDKMDAYFQDKCYETIVAKKDKTASETDLITIGRNMKTELDKLEHLDEITHIIMENQISPIANRMKTIQGMLAQYFIMKYDRQVHIEFVSSVNKLRFLEKQQTNNSTTNILSNELVSSENPIIDSSQPDNCNSNVKTTYKEHKRDAVYYTSQMLEQNINIISWKDSMLTKKKDDLADCFLQGVWYMNSKSLLYVDNTFVIKSV